MNTTLSRTFFFLAGLAVGGVAVAYYFAPSAFVFSSAPLESTSTSSLPPASPDIEVADQPAAVSVEITSVTVRPPGVWVAVQDVNEDSSLGNVLGAQFIGGPRAALTIALLRNTLPHRAYAIVLYRDDGDNTFTPGKDSVYIDFDTGEPAEAIFHTH